MSDEVFSVTFLTWRNFAEKSQTYQPHCGKCPMNESANISHSFFKKTASVALHLISVSKNDWSDSAARSLQKPYLTGWKKTDKFNWKIFDVVNCYKHIRFNGPLEIRMRVRTEVCRLRIEAMSFCSAVIFRSFPGHASFFL